MTCVSIVIPVYYNQENLQPLYQNLHEKVFSKADFNYEIVFVDDGSKDESWSVLSQLAIADENIRIIKLSRNFGSHAAILCGLVHATGDCAVVKTADLQEPSEMIFDMVQKWREGNNVVLAVREDRQESVGQKMFASMYYTMVRKVALPDMPRGGFDTFLLDKKVIKVLELMDERNSAITGQILWSGFRTAEVYYTRRIREIGKSRWTLKKKARLVMDTLFSFSTVPITIMSFIGSVSCLVAAIWAIVALVNKLIGGIDVAGWTSLFIFNLFSFGVIILSLSICGGYLWRTFESSRNRPAYIIEDLREGKTNEEEERN